LIAVVAVAVLLKLRTFLDSEQWDTWQRLKKL